MTIKVEVTKEDIANGERENSCKCPVALALSRLGTDVSVGNGEIGFWLGDKYRLIEIPDMVDDFITQFDNGKEVEPFEFTLNV